jgi:nucleotide-binding universal stress UspA family protein
MPFKRILFPIDFSQQCSEFAAYVAGVVKRLDAELTLLHVIDSVPLAYYGMDPAMSMAAAYAEEMSERRKNDLDTLLRDEFGALRVKRITEVGDPATVITQYAVSNGVQLIMMPTHGYGPFRRLLLGSVTAKVLHDADCPVWTSAHQDAAEPQREQAFRNILCAVDLTPESVRLLQSAAAIAAQLQGNLRLVHAIPAIDAATDFSRRALGTHEVMYDAVHLEIEKLQREAGTNAEVCLETGRVAKVVRNAALRHDSDLVIVGRGHIHETLGRLRTSTYSIIRDSPCPVLSVYPGPCREALLAGDSISLAMA